MARPMPEPRRLVVKNGSNMRATSTSDMPTPRSAHGDLDVVARRAAAPARARPAAPGIGAPASSAVAGARPRRAAAREHRVAGVGHQVDHHLAQPIGVGGRGDALGGLDDHVGRPALAGDHRLRGVADQPIELDRVVGQRDRLGVVEHVVDDAIEARHLALDVGGDAGHFVGRGDAAPQRAQRPLDDHQRVADLVRDHGRQAAEGRQPLALRRLALEAVERAGQRVEGAGQEPRVLVVPRASASGGCGRQRQDAGRRHLAHGRGEGADRPRDRAGHREAEERRDQHRHGGGRGQRRVQVAQEGQMRRARARRRCASGPPAPGAGPRPQRPRRLDHQPPPDRFVLLAVDRRPQHAGRRRARRAAPRSTSAGSVEPRGWPPSTNTTSLRVMRLDAIGERPIEAQAGGQRAEHLGLRRIDEDRHRHDLQQAARPATTRRRPIAPASAALTIRCVGDCVGRQPGLADDRAGRCRCGWSRRRRRPGSASR